MFESELFKSKIAEEKAVVVVDTLKEAHEKDVIHKQKFLQVKSFKDAFFDRAMEQRKGELLR